jgi:hypothetical protein
LLNLLRETNRDAENTISGTFWAQSAKNEKADQKDNSEATDNKEINYEVYKAQAKPHQRDRAKFFVLDLA